MSRRREQPPPSLARKRLARSRLRSGQYFQTFGKAEGLEGFPASAVVVGIVGVEPVTLRIHGEIGDLGQLRGLDEELLLGNESGDQRGFGFVQMKLLAV